MGLRNVLEKHALGALIGLCVAVASATAGTVGYFMTQKCDMDKGKLDAKVSRLQDQMVSIERSVGEGQPSLFDVTRLIVKPQNVKSIPATFQSFQQGQFFIAVPDLAGWMYQESNELAILKETLPGGIDDEVLKLLSGSLGEAKVHLWRTPRTITFRPSLRPALQDMGPTRLSLYPRVVVQVMTEEDFRRIGGALLTEDNDKEVADLLAKLESLSEEAENLVRETGAAAAIPSVAHRTPGLRQIHGSSGATVSQVGDARLEMERMLGNMFRGDFAGTLLGGIAQSVTRMSQLFENLSAELVSAQKKGSVLYISSRLRFDAVEIEGAAGRSPLFIDQEFFVVTSRDAAVFVTVQIPSIDGRTLDESRWVSEWLAGLRVPLGS